MWRHLETYTSLVCQFVFLISLRLLRSLDHDEGARSGFLQRFMECNHISEWIWYMTCNLICSDMSLISHSDTWFLVWTRDKTGGSRYRPRCSNIIYLLYKEVRSVCGLVNTSSSLCSYMLEDLKGRKRCCHIFMLFIENTFKKKKKITNVKKIWQ